MDSLLVILDVKVKEYESYVDKKEEKIRSVKSLINDTDNLDYKTLYSLNMDIFNLYKGFKSDSAISYIEKAILLAESHHDKTNWVKSKTLLAYLFSSTGMYVEAISVLSDVAGFVPKDVLPCYYEAFMKTYSELGFYTNSKSLSKIYYKKSNFYRDSLLNSIDKNTFLFMSLKESMYRDSYMADSSIYVNDIILKKIEPYTPEYSLALYNRAMDYRLLNDSYNMKTCLALSALSDITQAINDQASLWMLADILYKEGDIDRAYRYIRYSWGAITTFNARLRSWQSSEVLSMIDSTYQKILEDKNVRQTRSLIFISILTLILLVLILVVFIQNKKISSAKTVLRDNNLKLQLLNVDLIKSNDELNRANKSLNELNSDLNDANRIKEEYIGRFLTMCSFYVDQLETERKKIYKKIVNGKVSEVVSELKSLDNKEHDLYNLYKHFDHAFLQLYPNFIEDFNNLLQDDDRIIPKKGELLNVELRIFALIRLGIDDSSKIASFLHYSVNTIYNYRAKVKNRSKVNRDDFEKMVKNIGL